MVSYLQKRDDDAEEVVGRWRVFEREKAAPIPASPGGILAMPALPEDKLPRNDVRHAAVAADPIRILAEPLALPRTQVKVNALT